MHEKGAFPFMHSIEALVQAYGNAQRENAPQLAHLRLHAVPNVK